MPRKVSKSTRSYPKSPRAKRKIHTVMSEYKRGTLKSGSSGKKVTKRSQAVAIALSSARKVTRKKRKSK